MQLFLLFSLIGTMMGQQIFLRDITWAEYKNYYPGILTKSNSFQIFKQNIEFILDSNEKAEISPFLHVDTKEFSKRFSVNEERIPDQFLYSASYYKNIFRNNAYFNWRDKGVTNDPKNIEVGSWIFVVKDIIETKIRLSTGYEISVDKDNILLCSLVESPYWFLKRSLSNPILLSDYPRSFNERNKCIETLIDHNNKVESNSLQKLSTLNGKFNIYDSPVIVELYLDPTIVQFYDGTILNLSSTNKESNYFAIIIGYGHDNDHDYWIIKMNFGVEWGNNGNLILDINSTAIKYTYQI